MGPRGTERCRFAAAVAPTAGSEGNLLAGSPGGVFQAKLEGIYEHDDFTIEFSVAPRN